MPCSRQSPANDAIALQLREAMDDVIALQPRETADDVIAMQPRERTGAVQPVVSVVCEDSP